MLEHDTCPGRPEFSLIVLFAEGSRLSDGQEGRNDRRESGKRKDARRVLCGSTPEDTVSSGAIRDESRSSTRVSRPFPRGRALVCVPLSSNPRDGASFFPVALFLSLIPFRSPMRRFLSLSPSSSQSTILLSFFLFLSILSLFIYPPLSYPVSSLHSIIPVHDYSHYTPLTQLCRGPYDVSLILSPLPLPSPPGIYDITEAVTMEEQNSHQQGVLPMYSNLTYFRKSYQCIKIYI